MPSDRDIEGRPAQAVIAQFSRCRTRLRWLKAGAGLIVLSLVLWMLKFRGGPWSESVIVAITAFSAATGAIFWITWRCPACRKWPGHQDGVLNYCGSCAIPLAANAFPRIEQTPQRAEWVVATLRPRAWWVRGAFVLPFAGCGLAGWLLRPADLRSWGLGILFLGLFGWVILVGRIWHCPECKGSLPRLGELSHFCTRCGVPHSRKGLERARARA